MTNLDEHLAQMIANQNRKNFQNECHAMSKEALCMTALELYDKVINSYREYSKLLPIVQGILKVDREKARLAKELGFAADWEARMMQQDAIDFPEDEL